MRTFSRAAFDEAARLWADGEFSDEWKPYRHRAAMRGFIYPPDGTKWDSWSDDEPSQRAMLVRAIRETPKLLEAAIDRSGSWGEAIAFLLARRDEWRDELDVVDREIAHRRHGESTRVTSAMSLKAIITRIGQS